MYGTQKLETSAPGKQYKVYSYLLSGKVIDRANQVWVADICYVPLNKGFAYLVVIMDWYSGKVLSWRLSNILEADFCVEAFEVTIQDHVCPDISNTDYGTQFTSEVFTGELKNNHIQISMDGKGCYRDNIFVERLCEQ